MNKPIEQRYPSGPAIVGEKKPGGKHASQPYYKANTIFPEGLHNGYPPRAATPSQCRQPSTVAQRQA